MRTTQALLIIAVLMIFTSIMVTLIAHRPAKRPIENRPIPYMLYGT